MVVCLYCPLKDFGVDVQSSGSSTSGMRSGKGEAAGLGVAGTSCPAGTFVNRPGSMIDGMRADAPKGEPV